MKFRFPLQKVMQHRQTVEDLAERDFQEAMAELNGEIRNLEEMKNQVHMAHVRCFERQTEGGQAAPALSQVYDFLKGQDVRIERQRLKVQEIEKRVEELREILRQRAIDYKIIEELKEKQFKEYKIERRKREQKNTDDINLMRFRPGDVEE